MNKSLQDLQTIPGVGRSIAQDLTDLGIRRVKDLKKRDPERLYCKLCALRGQHIDRCVFYVFRCAPEKKHNPRLLKWWNWKDHKNGTSRMTHKGQPVKNRAPLA